MQGLRRGVFTVIVKVFDGDKERTSILTLKINEKRCIIATVTYGSEVSTEVNFLRWFRDEIVL